ncbi:transmembrane and immunoglobulin domain-containing protein 1-like [Harmonia axyridis]|uniref:transmembrane and immunoglobulin domain-containing protein 1-like n=1 Tax=Harmonia axyridis TaxID=115357 RepID=UPI001E279832|nr:transmembrane and immunoglobulin domain-containing protein 1-like [Harmonia axyridis]
MLISDKFSLLVITYVLNSYVSAFSTTKELKDNPTTKFVDSQTKTAGGPQKPYFDDVGPRNITAVVGQSAILNCRVKHPGDRTISWMRKRDLHILTSGIHTYTGDARFGVHHPEHSDDWNLQVEFVQKRDAGVYECQVNTEPKINYAVWLHVEDAQATISGPPEIYVKKGSTISLTCSINIHSNPPSSVLWYHGQSVIDFDSPRGGISLETEKTEAGTTSKLLVTKALLSDSGNYTCMPSNATPASTVVHVLNGEHPAAMQTSSTSPMRCLSSIVAFALAATASIR